MLKNVRFTPKVIIVLGLFTIACFSTTGFFSYHFFKAQLLQIASNANIDDLLKILDGYEKLFGFIVFGFLAVALFIAALLGQKVARPMRQFSVVAEAIGRGFWDVRVPIESRDEMGDLASAFNSMAERLKTSHKDLEEANKTLERKVAERTKVLDEQNMQIKKQHDNIQGSIRYAQQIQKATLPSKMRMIQFFQYFSIYKPKDVVSGDFYWFFNAPFEGYPDKNFIAVVDCTGHGVPGAFMSMIGARLLNGVIYRRKIYNPCQILELLDQDVRSALKQDETDNRDGMDVCLCLMEKQPSGQTKVTYSGAKRPLFYYSQEQQEMVKLPATRRSVGGEDIRGQVPKFTNQVVMLEEGDMMYMFTDGFPDQNNKARKKFGTKNLVKRLGELAAYPLDAQERELLKTLEEHSEGEPQRDDITVLGIRP